MRPVKVGLIGCGRIARAVHIPILTSLPGVDLVALAEPDQTRLGESVSLAPGAHRFNHYKELVKLPDMEAIVICLPNALHAEAAAAAMQQGKHIYVEKPLATTLEEAEAVLAAWKTSSLVGMVGFNYRFNRLYRAVRESVLSGRIGKPVGARCVFTTTEHDGPSWKDNLHTGGGVLLDLASHEIDMARFIFDSEVAEVFSSLRSLHNEGDTAAIELRMENDVFVTSFCSLGTVEHAALEVYGSTGRISINRYRSLVPRIDGLNAPGRLNDIVHGLKSVAGLPHIVQKIRSPLNEPSFKNAIATFIAAVRAGNAAVPDLIDGYRSLAVTKAAERSASTRDAIIPDYAVVSTTAS